MDLFDAIARRQSYREAFTEEAVPRADLERMVQAGLDAPSGCNTQTTRFVIIDNHELLRQIKGVMAHNNAMKTATAMIACIVSRRPEPSYEGMSFDIEDCAAATENILLAITDLGYATVWTDGALRLEERAERIGALLGVPDDRVVRILLPLGRPATAIPRREKLGFDDRASFNRWCA
jgi:nitroreductase